MARDLAGNGDGQERLYSRRKEDRNGRMRTDDACGRADPMRSPLNAGNGDKQCGVFRAAVGRSGLALPMEYASMSFSPSLSLPPPPRHDQAGDRDDQERTTEIGGCEQISMRERERMAEKGEDLVGCVGGA